jgi:hypothetical protein
MNMLDKICAKFGRTASPEPEFLLFKAAAGVLPPLPADSANAPMLADLLKKNSKQVTWEEIEAGKLALVAVMPQEVLQAQFGSLADEYETVTGDKPFTQGAFTNPPTTPEGWRAGVVSLMQELAKFRRAKLMFEQARSTVGIPFGLLLLVLILFGLLLVGWQLKYNQIVAPPLWQPLLFTGLCGALFSFLGRLYLLTWTPRITAQIEDVQALKKGLVLNCFLSMAEGMVAAGIIYLLFTSELLQGTLFPTFKEPVGESAGNVVTYLFFYLPAGPTDLPKLLVWAFIAGFAERLVPDKLNLLAGAANDDKGKK